MDLLPAEWVLSGIIFIDRNGLRWRDAAKEYGPPKTLYNRWKRWGDKGVFARMMDGPLHTLLPLRALPVASRYRLYHERGES